MCGATNVCTGEVAPVISKCGTELHPLYGCTTDVNDIITINDSSESPKSNQTSVNNIISSLHESSDCKHNCLSDLDELPCHENKPVSIQNGATETVFSVSNNNTSNNYDGLKISSINVCGLCSKMKSPDFSEFVNNYDIVFLTETKLDDLDECNI